jgi:CRISPR-associated protein (TIGR03984 family)
MSGEIKQIGYTCESIAVTGMEADLADWFCRQPTVGANAWLLAHADDGVIWGEIRDGKLALSGQLFPSVSPPLRVVSLEQARLFGDAAEVRLWKQGKEFRAGRVEDRAEPNSEAFDQQHLLWGTAIEEAKDEFTLLKDASQGLKHAVPLSVPRDLFGDRRHRPLRLIVRNYLACDADGRVRIAQARLVGIALVPPKGGSQ